MIKLTMYNNSAWSLCRMPDSRFFEREHKKKHKSYKNMDKNEVNRISLSRTKSRIREICLTNSFEYFMTITVNSKNADRFSLQEVQDKMKKICKKIRRKNNEFKYIFITERHKDGAFHFHGMCKSLDDLYTNKNGYLSSKAFDSLGFNSFDFIKNYNACCFYITKYITKDCVKNENNQIYFCSRGLKKADTELLIDSDLKSIFTFANVFENEYCQKYDFDISKLPKNHSRNLNAFFKYNDECFQKDNNYITNWLQLFTNGKVNIKI